ncbi:MAG: hypothetical protein QM703_15230 [Gemmatales bacterium]
MTQRRRTLLILLLRACGIIDLLALTFALIPHSWIRISHGHLGMGPFPEETIALYLVRSSCLMYVVHGVLLIFVSFDIDRYLPLIRLLAWIAVIHGVMLIVIDSLTGMPWWWTLGEGGLLIAWGTLVLGLTKPSGASIRM